MPLALFPPTSCSTDPCISEAIVTWAHNTYRGAITRTCTCSNGRWYNDMPYMLYVPDTYMYMYLPTPHEMNEGQSSLKIGISGEMKLKGSHVLKRYMYIHVPEFS